ncbi:MAG: 8-oxoguanine deaminase [Candidatus Marinimicrobia bacterium]|nr:8-oxoguanine deaminase [Candidatus Neomarinimicrobiota bacterium]
MNKILIKNPLLMATMNDNHEEYSGGHILIEGDKIQSIGKDNLDIEVDEVIDANNMVILPGFINTHHHFYQTLTRNIPKMQDMELFSWLADHYEVWRELTEEGVTVSTKTAIAELMKSGTTTSSDHLYLFPRKSTKELIDIEIEAAKEMGIRFYPTRGSMSLGKPHGGLPPEDVIQTEKEIQADSERLINKYHDESDGSMLRIALAPCSPFSVTPDLMKQTADYAKTNNILIHTHLAETLDEEKFCIDTFGKRPVEYIKSLGWLDKNAWFAHTVHLNDNEIKLMGEVGCGASHCPSSNMRLGSGIARIKEMMEAGISVSLALDGSASNDSSNMLSEIRNTMLLSRLRKSVYWLSARDALWIATRGGAQVLGRNDIGELAVGKQADIAMFSVDSLEYAGGLSDPLASLIFTVRTSPVDFLIVNGKVKVREGKLDFDEKMHIQEHNRVSNEMLKKASQNSGINFIGE